MSEPELIGFDEPDKGIVVPGVRFTLTFYFVCPDHHVHPIWLQFNGIDPDGMTQEAITKARDIAQLHIGKEMRIASEEEIEIFEHEAQKHLLKGVALPESGYQKKTVNGRTFFVLPGPKEVQ